jgi:hypothetical protein
LERQLTPVHSVRLLSVINVTDFGGETVRHNALVSALGPKSESISQLMFLDGEKNSVLVEVCGSRVPDVWDVLGVVLTGDLVVVVERAVVLVDDELEDEGLLEQAASARAQTGRTSRRIDQGRSVRGIAGA